MGAPMFSTSSPACARTVEWRPSAPTTRSARTSRSLALSDEVRRFGLHAQVKSRIGLALIGEEIEEVPLGHEDDETAPGGKVREVGERDLAVADDAADLAQLLMRSPQEIVEQPELVHQLERRGMDGIAAEVAQEIRVLLEDDDRDAGAAEQKAEHHAGRPAPGDAALHGRLAQAHAPRPPRSSCSVATRPRCRRGLAAIAEPGRAPRPAGLCDNLTSDRPHGQETATAASRVIIADNDTGVATSRAL
jgi:hypothetical protein